MYVAAKHDKHCSTARRRENSAGHSMREHSICYFVFMTAAVEALRSHKVIIRPCRKP